MAAHEAISPEQLSMHLGFDPPPAGRSLRMSRSYDPAMRGVYEKKLATALTTRIGDHRVYASSLRMNLQRAHGMSEPEAYRAVGDVYKRHMKPLPGSK